MREGFAVALEPYYLFTSDESFSCLVIGNSSVRPKTKYVVSIIDRNGGGIYNADALTLNIQAYGLPKLIRQFKSASLYEIRKRKTWEAK